MWHWSDGVALHCQDEKVVSKFLFLCQFPITSTQQTVDGWMGIKTDILAYLTRAPYSQATSFLNVMTHLRAERPHSISQLFLNTIPWCQSVHQWRTFDQNVNTAQSTAHRSHKQQSENTPWASDKENTTYSIYGAATWRGQQSCWL